MRAVATPVDELDLPPAGLDAVYSRFGVMGFADPDITLAQLAEIGVRRISIGGGLSRVALNAMMVAAREMKAGKFSFVRDMISTKEMGDAFRS